MREVISHLNYLHVLVVGAVGFAIGAVWFSALFGKVWMVEMKFTEEHMKEAKERGMTPLMLMSLILTLLSTFGLAALMAAHGAPNWKHGAAFGLFVGLFGPAVRMLNGGVWEGRSIRLQAITVGHEIVMYMIQGAILAAWH